MKISTFLTTPILAATFCFSLNAVSAEKVSHESASVEIVDPSDPASVQDAIRNFDELSEAESSYGSTAYQRCSTVYVTKYTSVKIGTEKVVARFNYNGDSCRRYGLSIETNYEGHDLEVNLYKKDGTLVRGGSAAISVSLYEAGEYYWTIDNVTTSSPYTYGGVKYEARYKG